MKKKGIEFRTKEWIYFQDSNITNRKKSMFSNITGIKLKQKVYYIITDTICDATDYKDFAGNDIYFKDIIQYETYNINHGIEYHIRHISKNKEGIACAGTSVVFAKTELSELSSLNIMNMRVISNSIVNIIPEGTYKRTQEVISTVSPNAIISNITEDEIN